MTQKKDYLAAYGAKRVPTFAMGGAAPMGGAPAPAPMGGGDPAMGGAPMEQDPIMLAQQAVETQDGALALEVCTMLLQAAGAGAPADPAAMGGAPAPMAANGMAMPRYKNGGGIPKLTRNVQK